MQLPSASAWPGLADSSVVLVLLVLLFVVVIIDGLKKLAGTSTPKSRERCPGESTADWLMGDSMKARSSLGLPGLRVRVERSAAEPDEWDADVVPQLAASHASHLFLGARLSKWIWPDVVIQPPPVKIDASPAEVWDVLLDFPRYGEWNGFHRKIEIVDKPRGAVGLRMTFGLGPIMGTLVETSTIYYLDEQRHIFIYGLRGDEGPSSMRVVWLVGNADGSTTFHSYDTIGGYPALLCRVHIARMVHLGFAEQHLAIRERVHALKRRAHEAEAVAVVAPRGPAALGVCLVTGGSGFLGAHIVRMLASLKGVARVHVIDLQPPKDASSLPPTVHFERGSVADAAFVADVMRRVKPDTIFHSASVIDLRPGAAAERINDAVNVDGTRTLLALAQEHRTKRFVYTSSIECAYHDNSCFEADEATTPYIAHPSNPYQRTKIIAEREVLDASAPYFVIDPRYGDCRCGLVTVAIRPAHIYGHLHDDEIGRFLESVPANFRAGLMAADFRNVDGAEMSMVHVENCALAHVLAASQAHHPHVHGRAYFVSDFDENIVCVYRAMGGRGLPIVCLPYWLLLVLVRLSIAMHLLLLTLSFGIVGFLQGKTGLHDGAIAAALPCTVSCERAKSVLGYGQYDGHVTRQDALASCKKPFAPLIGAAQVAAAVEHAHACAAPPRRGSSISPAQRKASPARRKTSPARPRASPARRKTPARR